LQCKTSVSCRISSNVYLSPAAASGDASHPFASGAIGAWAAERGRAVDEAVPLIIERLRPKYGRMYNFHDAQPGNVRLLAMAIQPSLTNR
jgi:hypothetical protein